MLFKIFIIIVVLIVVIGSYFLMEDIETDPSKNIENFALKCCTLICGDQGKLFKSVQCSEGFSALNCYIGIPEMCICQDDHGAQSDYVFDENYCVKNMTI